MIKKEGRADKPGASSIPPAPLSLEAIWDDETVPGLDLDDPLNAFDRVTAVPDLPPDEYAKQVMQTAIESRLPPLPSTLPPAPPAITLRPDEYFCLDSESPPLASGTDGSGSSGAHSDSNAVTTRPPAVPPPGPTEPAERSRPDHHGDRSAAAPDPATFAEYGTAPIAKAVARTRVSDMKDRYAMGDFSGALLIAESILAHAPDEPEASRYARSCRDVLMQMYSARLGALDKVVTVSVPSDQIRWLTLDHRAGFLLSLIDGGSTVEQILDISGMPRLDALRIMYQLLDERVISLGT